MADDADVAGTGTEDDPYVAERLVTTWRDAWNGVWYAVTGRRGQLDIGFVDRRVIYPRAERMWKASVFLLLMWIAWHVMEIATDLAKILHAQEVIAQKELLK